MKRQVYRWARGRDKLVEACATVRGAAKMKSRRAGTATILAESTELGLVKWVNDLREEGVPVTPALLCLEALEVAQQNGVAHFAASTTWLRLFLARHRLSLRARTRQGQQSPEDAEDVLLKFSTEIKERMLRHGVRQLCNADQTAVFFEYLPKKTITNTGEKTVWIRCGGKDKERITVMLMADANGTKYPPSLVFHSRPSTIPEVALENLALRHGFGKYVWTEIELLQRETGMMIYGNATSWWNSTLSFDFLRHHFASRAPDEEPVMLLWDEFSGHWTPDIQAYAARIGVHLAEVPAGSTSVCQPADVAWMRPFKRRIRSYWVDYLREQLQQRDPTVRFKLVPPGRATIARWVLRAWEDLPSSIIVNGYKMARIEVPTQDEIDEAKLYSDVVELLEQLHLTDRIVGDIDPDADIEHD